MFQSVQRHAVIQGRLTSEGQLGGTRKQRLQADVQFHACQCRPQTDVNTGAEADVFAGVDPGGIKFVRAFEERRITVGSAQQKQYGLARMNGLTLYVECLGSNPGAPLNGSLVAQHLLDRVGPTLGFTRRRSN